MKPTKSNAYDVVLSPCEDVVINSLYQSPTIFDAAANEGLSPIAVSDLLVERYTYKPLTLNAVGELSIDDYKLLKRVKGAEFISYSAANLIYDNNIPELIKNGDIEIKSQYIMTISNDPSLPIADSFLPGSDRPFGIKLLKNGRFHFLLDSAVEPDLKFFNIKGHRFNILSVTPIVNLKPEIFVLQTDVNVDNFSFRSNSRSRYKLSYDNKTNTQLVSKGSVIDRSDFRGHTIDWIAP